MPLKSEFSNQETEIQKEQITSLLQFQHTFKHLKDKGHLNQLMKTMFGILNEIKQSRLLEKTNAPSSPQSADRIDNNAEFQQSKQPKFDKYTELDLREHLKLTCGIIIDDISDHWDSYRGKFVNA